MSDQMDRRLVLRGGAMLAGAGAMMAASTAPAGAAGSVGGWKPAAEPQDAWYEFGNHRHRMVFDAASAAQGKASAGYANNSYYADKVGYGLKPADLGVIIILRHLATPYAYTDAIWRKYGAAFAEVMELDKAESARAAKLNPLLTGDPNADAPPPGFEFMKEATLSALAAKGTRFAVCALATKFIAGKLAAGGAGDAAAIEKELAASLIPGGHMVPAGILAVGRAQEHGYALAVVE